jgi:hypothetical protein
VRPCRQEKSSSLRKEEVKKSDASARLLRTEVKLQVCVSGSEAPGQLQM